MINLAEEASLVCVQKPPVMLDQVIWLDAINVPLQYSYASKGLGIRLLSIWTGVKTIELLIVDNIRTSEPYASQ